MSAVGGIAFLNLSQDQPIRDYLIQRSAPQNTIEVWSIQRLPFEPKGWCQDFRTDIRNAVGVLRSGPNEIFPCP